MVKTRENDSFETFSPLPPPSSPGQRGDPFGNDEEAGEVSKLAEVPAVKRKAVKRPQPKLDSHRLTSEKGLPALRTLFDDVHFKGKGHEAEDVRLLMQKMENWAHRLYPKLQFEDFIDKVEKLGAKKEVQTCLKRIRLDMPLIHEDFTGDDEVPPEPDMVGDSDPFSSQKLPIHSTPAPAGPLAASLTDEQRQRMELNRQRALEKRLARQQQQQQQLTDSSLQAGESSVNHSEHAVSVNRSKGQDDDDDDDDDEEPASISYPQQPIKASESSTLLASCDSAQPTTRQAQ